MTKFEIPVGLYLTRPSGRDYGHFQPCTHCGDLLGEGSQRGWGDTHQVRLTDNEWASFCSAHCLALHVQQHPELPVWHPLTSILLTYPYMEEELASCYECQSNTHSSLCAFLSMPEDYGLFPWYAVCSLACLVNECEKSEAFWMAEGVGKWGIPLCRSGEVPELPRRIASLRRLRHKLRPRDLARLGF